MSKKVLGKLSSSTVELTDISMADIEFRMKNSHKLVPFHLPLNYRKDSYAKRRDGTRRLIARKGDPYISPSLPAQLIGFQAQTHNGKTLTMRDWARWLTVKENFIDYDDDQIVVYVDVENTTTDIGINLLSQYSNYSADELARGKVQDWANLMNAKFTVDKMGLFHVAMSTGIGSEKQILSVESIYNEILYLSRQKYGRPLKISAIFIDYLQALDYSNTDSDIRHLKVRNDTFSLRKMGAVFNCPTIMGLQAKQDLKYSSRNMYIPQMYDAQDSSTIAQRCDKLFSQWMPKTSLPVGGLPITVNGFDDFVVEEDEMWFQVLKQRGSLPSGARWRLGIDYSTNELYPLPKYHFTRD